MVNIFSKRSFNFSANILSIPVTVCGDIHGQFHDLMKLFQTGDHVPKTNHIVMGDFIDRGYNNHEVFVILLLLKAGSMNFMMNVRESRAMPMLGDIVQMCLTI
ncbi:hypothetical protein Fmac_022985 [Flemingia macrophylla]|uniref:protein-serine/threonine phosphatase n=1 Tax=Flemingia macrophylla TaxID=520843 RepID=A0ABD1LK95_9FABA